MSCNYSSDMKEEQKHNEKVFILDSELESVDKQLKKIIASYFMYAQLQSQFKLTPHYI